MVCLIHFLFPAQKSGSSLSLTRLTIVEEEEGEHKWGHEVVYYTEVVQKRLFKSGMCYRGFRFR